VRTFWRRVEIEALAFDILVKFQGEVGTPLAPPIDVDLIGEVVCDLRWDWDLLAEPTGTTIWAGLYPHERLVVLNERHTATFSAKPGLERFSKAHEIGHDVVHVDKATLHHPMLPGFAPPGTFICRDGDKSWRERHAEWFAGSLLMPRGMFVEVARQFNLLRWSSLYDLASVFEVTISALRVRLAELKLNFVDARGNIHRSEAESAGQILLGLR
jgi:IrrE N-terminal-like domain